jgi:diguanylate cyclase (GGDEF)-like protein
MLGEPAAALAAPWPALASLGLAGLLTALRLTFRRTIIVSALLWALAATFLALAAGGDRLASSVYLTTGGLVLVLSLVELSHRMAYLDELTGLPARRALNEALLRLGDRYAIAMVDIDHFKHFNDRHGHAAGDQLLRMIGTTLARSPGGGRAFRYGGEEFAILFPGRGVKDVLPHLESLRKAVQATGFTLRSPDRPRRRPKTLPPAEDGRQRVSVTVSIGVAQPGRDTTAPEAVVRAADRALYRAKREGRNRVLTESVRAEA